GYRRNIHTTATAAASKRPTPPSPIHTSDPESSVGADGGGAGAIVAPDAGMTTRFAASGVAGGGPSIHDVVSISVPSARIAVTSTRLPVTVTRRKCSARSNFLMASTSTGFGLGR